MFRSPYSIQLPLFAQPEPLAGAPVERLCSVLSGSLSSTTPMCSRASSLSERVARSIAIIRVRVPLPEAA